MILADDEIKKQIKKGELLLNEKGKAIDDPEAKNISYDLSTKKFYSKEQDNKGTDTFILQPLGSVFVASAEIINLPNNISAEVKLKYSLMTDGLMLDAPLYQPGHHGSNIFFRLTKHKLSFKNTLSPKVSYKNIPKKSMPTLCFIKPLRMLLTRIMVFFVTRRKVSKKFVSIRIAAFIQI